MNLESITNNLEKRINGIYYSKTKSSVSYPDDGNEGCMQIERDSFWFNHRNNVIVESIKKHSPSKTFFDIGGGNGFVSKRLQEEGIETVLVEPGNNGASNAKIRGLKNIICSTLDDAEFKNNSLESVGFLMYLSISMTTLDF